MTNDVVDVAIESREGGYFQVANISKEALVAAVEKATSDGAALSLVSLDSAALVVPWFLVQRISYLSALVDDDDDSDTAWTTVWERANGFERAAV